MDIEDINRREFQNRRTRNDDMQATRHNNIIGAGFGGDQRRREEERGLLREERRRLRVERGSLSTTSLIPQGFQFANNSLNSNV